MIEWVAMIAATEKISPVNIKERQKIGIRAGDTVRVWQKIREGEKTRLQAFEGLVIARKHGLEPGATFTVRRVVGGVGVEKTFPLYATSIGKLEIVKRSRVRRAKLYYVRDKAVREVRKKLRQVRFAKPEVLEENVEGAGDEPESKEKETVSKSK